MLSTRRNAPPRTSRARHAWRALAGIITVATAALGAACADAPSAPGRLQPATLPTLAKGGKKGGPDKPGSTQDTVWVGEQLATPVVASGLQRRQPLDSAITTTFVVTKEGGAFTVPGAGLEIWFQTNTVPGPTAITVTALAGDVVAYEFGPHGTSFPKSVILVQDLTGTNYKAKTDATFDVGYFGSTADLDLSTRSALVRERLQHLFDAESGKLYAAVNHFSGYMVSWGFSRGAY